MEYIPENTKTETQENLCCASGRKKKRSDAEVKDLCNRLSRIEGQVRGVRKMVDEGAYCTDIITQVSAINAALNAFNKKLLETHIKTCVTSDVQAENYDSRDELISLLSKLMK